VISVGRRLLQDFISQRRITSAISEPNLANLNLERGTDVTCIGSGKNGVRKRPFSATAPPSVNNPAAGVAWIKVGNPNLFPQRIYQRLAGFGDSPKFRTLAF
jgi:hypothetical protein